jgi:phage shock protein A
MAGILERMGMIAKANVNDLLDKAQNPEAELNYFIEQMRGSIQEAEKAVSEAVAQQKLLQINAEQARKQASEWESRSEKAVKAGRDDLASEALRQKNKYEQEAATYNSQYEEQKVLADKLRGQLEVLRTKFRDTELNKNNMIARYRMAKSAQKITGVRDPVTGLNQGDYSRMERKIMGEEALAEMADTNTGSATQAEIDKLGPDTSLEDELAALKARLSPPKGETTS